MKTIKCLVVFLLINTQAFPKDDSDFGFTPRMQEVLESGLQDCDDLVPLTNCLLDGDFIGLDDDVIEAFGQRVNGILKGQTGWCTPIRNLWFSISLYASHIGKFYTFFKQLEFPVDN